MTLLRTENVTSQYGYLEVLVPEVEKTDDDAKLLAATHALVRLERHPERTCAVKLIYSKHPRRHNIVYVLIMK